MSSQRSDFDASADSQDSWASVASQYLDSETLDRTSAGSWSQSKSGTRGSQRISGGIDADASVCVFRVEGSIYALPVEHVGEIFVPKNIAKVPLVPTGVLGLYNLRGTALALVDIARVLDLPSNTGAPSTGPGQILVLNFGAMILGARIDNVVGVMPHDLSDVVPSDRRGDHPAISGVIEFTQNQSIRASLLDPQYVLARLDALSLKRSNPV